MQISIVGGDDADQRAGDRDQRERRVDGEASEPRAAETGLVRPQPLSDLLSRDGGDPRV
jgi:hypothetical protein